MLRALTVIAFLILPAVAIAQGAGLTIGTGAFDSAQPVEVSADEFTVDQDSGEAAFIGNVVVVQGDLRMSAAQVKIISADAADASGISRLLASGGVTFVTPTEAAEAQDAVYSVGAGTIVLTGDVLLTQGETAISGEKLTVDLETGQGRMEGRVRTVFTPGGNN